MTLVPVVHMPGLYLALCHARADVLPPEKKIKPEFQKRRHRVWVLSLRKVNKVAQNGASKVE